MNFHEMNLRDEIIASLDKLGYNSPTEVQERVVPLGIDGKNIVVQSHTGSGKTAAFSLPVLNTIDTKIRKPQALIIAPTRELVMQIRDEIRTLSGTMRMKSIAVFGGTSIRTQKFELDAGPQVIIATPGRLIDLIERKWIDISSIEKFVLDEVDQMLDMGFIDDVKYIWDSLPALKQVMTFSATYAPEIKNLISGHMGMEYEFIQMQSTPTVETIDHSFIRMHTSEKYPYLKSLIEKNPEKRIIVFTSTKMETEEIARYLTRDEFEASYIHGDLLQRQRIRTLKDYKEGRIRIFIATDVAARGLNLNNIELVVNYHVPQDPEAYIHRIGRTGRAGASGEAIMLVSPDETRRLDRVERTHKITIKEIDRDGNEVERVRGRNGDNHRGNSGGGRGRFGGGGRGFGGGGRSGGRSFGGERKPFNRDGGDRGGFGGERKSFGDRGDRGGFGGERKPFNREERGERPERRSFEDRGERKPFNRDGGDRGGRSFGGERKSFGDRKPFGDRGDHGDRGGFGGERKPFNREERGERPERRSFEDRGDRKPFNRDGGDRGGFGEKRERSFDRNKTRDFGERDERGFPKRNVPSRQPRFDRGH